MWPVIGTIWASVVFQFLVHFKISTVCASEIDELTWNWRHAVEIFSWGAWETTKEFWNENLNFAIQPKQGKRFNNKIKETQKFVYDDQKKHTLLVIWVYDYFTAKRQFFIFHFCIKQNWTGVLSFFSPTAPKNERKF